MKIISKYKDYYDSIAGQKGIDNTIIYNRNIQELNYTTHKKTTSFWNKINFNVIDTQIIPSNQRKFNGSYVGDKQYVLFIVGFCGKIYIGAKVYEYIKENDFSYLHNTKEIISYIYGLDNIIKEFENENIKKSYYYSNNYDYIKSFQNDKKLLEIFHQYKTPYFILFSDKDENNLIINGNLKDIEFYKVFDPFSTFQEIEMYISGVLGLNTNPIVEISDKHKIIGHGFDYKYSFRKEKKC